VFLILVDHPVRRHHEGRRVASAEVAARFVLDAMPGKQMAIDAELNAGLIDEDKAKPPRRSRTRSRVLRRDGRRLQVHPRRR
jgi:flagellar biosynthesis protein FlhA